MDKLRAWLIFLLAGLVALLLREALAAGQVESTGAEATVLAARLRAWQPLWAPRRDGELEEVASAIVAACRRSPWPSEERCPNFLGALSFKESSWHPDAVGALGLVQLHGAALAGETRQSASEPVRNLVLGLEWLRRCAFLCRLAERPSDVAALSLYAGLRCGPSRGASLVLRWEQELSQVAL